MICLKCGYCCIKYFVTIIKNPAKKLTHSNIVIKPSDKRCKYLKGSKSGKLSCKIHHLSLYKHTPCFSHNQTEFDNSNCRLGEYMLQHPEILKDFLH